MMTTNGENFALSGEIVTEAQELYSLSLDAAKKSFEMQLFSAAYHLLSAAVACAVQLRDIGRLLEAEGVAREQYGALRTAFHELEKEPVELSLYISLLQIIRTRLVLLPR
jgi:hypothetical protein